MDNGTAELKIPKEVRDAAYAFSVTAKLEQPKAEEKELAERTEIVLDAVHRVWTVTGTGGIRFGAETE